MLLFLDAMRRSFRIASIARVLGNLRYPTGASEIAALAARRDKAIERLLDFVVADRKCMAVAAKYHARRPELRRLYEGLEVVASRWYGGNFVPVSTLAFPKALDLALCIGVEPLTDDLGERVRDLFASRTYL
jgi:hypothetical protein